MAGVVSRDAPPYSAPVNAPLYTTEILRLAAQLPGPAVLAEVHGSGEQRSPTCGSMVRTEVQLGESGQIAALSQSVQACAFGQAAAAILAAGAPGKTRAEVEAAAAEIGVWLGGNGPVPSWPGIAALAPARSRTSRHGAILLPFHALLAALGEALA
jgi:NifU-like protein involved in Fe-S cluster formation